MGEDDAGGWWFGWRFGCHGGGFAWGGGRVVFPSGQGEVGRGGGVRAEVGTTEAGGVIGGHELKGEFQGVELAVVEGDLAVDSGMPEDINLGLAFDENWVGTGLEVVEVVGVEEGDGEGFAEGFRGLEASLNFESGVGVEGEVEGVGAVDAEGSVAALPEGKKSVTTPFPVQVPFGAGKFGRVEVAVPVAVVVLEEEAEENVVGGAEGELDLVDLVVIDLEGDGVVEFGVGMGESPGGVEEGNGRQQEEGGGEAAVGAGAWGHPQRERVS